MSILTNLFDIFSLPVDESLVRKISSLVDHLCLPGDFAYDRIGCHCIENWVEVWKRSKKRNFWGLIVDVVEYERNCSIYCKSVKNHRNTKINPILDFGRKTFCYSNLENKSLEYRMNSTRWFLQQSSDQKQIQFFHIR